MEVNIFHILKIGFPFSFDLILLQSCAEKKIDQAHIIYESFLVLFFYLGIQICGWGSLAQSEERWTLDLRV